MAKKITDENLNVNVSVNGGNEAKKKLGDLEKANRDLKNQQDDLRKAKQQLIAAGEKESAAYRQIEADLKKTKTQLDENSAAQKETRKEIGLTGLTMSQLVKEQRRLSSQIKTGTTQGTDDYNRLKKELQEVNKVINEQRDDLKGTAEAMGDNADAAETLSGAFDDIFGGLQSGNFAQVQTGLATVKQGIMGATKAGLAFIATPIGAAIAALATVGIAAKAWFDYNSAAVEAIKLTQQITGLSDGAADNARIRAKVLTDTFGGEMKENLEAARNLVTQFGISYDEAFDVIEGKLVRGQKNNNEFYDSLKEYPTFFAQAKFSAEEFANVIAAGYDLGIYSDKLPDALKEADISLREQTTATRDALVNAFGAAFTDDILDRVKRGETTTKDALKEISAEADKQNINIQQNAQLTADLFRGAGEDAGGAIKVFEALNVALNDQQRPLRESEQLMQDQIKATQELEEVQSALFFTGDKGFGLLIDRAKLFGTKTLTQILRAGVDVINWIIDLNNKSGVFSGILATVGVVATASFEILSTLVNHAREQFGGLGDIIEGVFTLDADKIKQGMIRSTASTLDMYEELKTKAKAAGDSIADAFSGKNKMERVSIDKFVSTETETTTTDDTTTTDNKGGGDIDADAQARANKEIETRKKVAEKLKAWEEERALEEEVAKFEKERQEEEREVIKKEEEFAKLMEDAAGETELLAQLEEEKELQLQAIRDRYAAERLEKDKIEKEKLRKQEEEWAAAHEKATVELEQVKAASLQFGLSTLRGFLDKKSALYKILFVMEKGAAIASVITNTSKALAEITAGTAAANVKAVAASPLTAGMPWVAVNTATGGKQALAVKLGAAMQIASIGASAIKGFEDGLYPVTRTDGKKYNAAYGGDAGTRLVHRPTVFSNNGGYLAGEGSKTEMIIDNDVFRRMDPAVVDHIMNVRRNVRGYETGMYPDVPGTAAGNTQPAPVDPELKAVLNLVAARLSEPIKTYTVYGYDDEENRQKIQDEIANSKQNGNLTP